jgi:Putative lactococcus lactis phage r1t holin
MFSLKFWQAALERAVKSAAQGVALAFFASDSGPANLFSLDWGNALGFALGAAVLSLLTSIGASGIGDKGTPAAFGPETVE